MRNRNKKRFAGLVLALTLALALLALQVLSVPVGPTISYIKNETSSTAGQAAPRPSDEGGYITTLNLDAAQQNYAWKAYVGNVTGGLALRDQDNFSIYAWPVPTTEQEVYISRNDSVDWNTINCSNQTEKESEDTALSIDSALSKSINKTFNESVHKQFQVSGRTITNSSCFAISTYVDDAAQGGTESDVFQEVLLADSVSNIVYASLIDVNTQGFDNETYDFQGIVAEDEGSGPNTYYFYVELG